MRGIDHIVHAVRDLDAAAADYARLGFTVGARNAHPWGTHNRIVQFPGCFIELLTVAEPEKIPQPSARRFSFGAFNRDFLTGGEGLSMLALESSDADADARAFRAAGIGDFEPFRFERTGSRPDGTEVAVAFSLAFAQAEDAPRAGFFVCQQHYPENFWNPAFQRHDNGATGIAGVVLVAEHPASHAAFLAGLAGAPASETADGGLWVQTPRGRIEITDAAGFRRRFRCEPPAGMRAGLQIAALAVAAPDAERVRRVIRDAGLSAEAQAEGLLVGPRTGRGAILLFAPPSG